ncbi:unnamed protein product [Clonostachys solani]|uniref:DUF7924 domain-containing protein n=1 Tax=Clonostachys solani TaxID=160281 RepID=A0A9P0EJA5_9HYPO|nr:unnamed protein product [Clonostachys solani]
MYGTRARVRALKLSAQASEQPQESPAPERTDPIGEKEDLNLQEAGQDLKVADKPPQRLYSLYENLQSTSPAFRQSSHGEHLLNWLQSIKPYRLRRCRSDTNIQLLPDFYTNTPPMSTLQDSTIPPQGQGTFCHSGGVSRVGELAYAAKVYEKRAVEKQGYRNSLRASKIFMLRAAEKVPSNIQSVMDLITSECGQPPTAAKSASDSYSNECANMAIRGANEESVRRFFDDYLFSKSSLPANVRRNEGMMKRGDAPIAASGAGKISTPNPDLLLGYDEESFPPQQDGRLGAWDANNAKFSFLSVDYKGDGSVSTGSLWVATNQCLVATTTCVNLMMKLRAVVLERGDAEAANSLDQHVFGLVANGTEARLFVTYADADQDGQRCVRRIFKWAEERKGRIEAAIDVILSGSLTAANKRGHDGSGPVTKRQRGESTDPPGV